MLLITQQNEKALFAYFEAWRVFTDPSSRGHDTTGHKLVQEVQELTQLEEIADYYTGNPAIAKQFGIVVPH